MPHFVNAEQEPELKAAKCISDKTSVIFTHPPPGRKSLGVSVALLPMAAASMAPEPGPQMTPLAFVCDPRDVTCVVADSSAFKKYPLTSR